MPIKAFSIFRISPTVLFVSLVLAAFGCDDEAVKVPATVKGPTQVVPAVDDFAVYRERMQRLSEAFAEVRATLGAELPEAKYRSAYLDAYLSARKAHQVLNDGLRPAEADRPAVHAAAKAMSDAEALASIFRRSEEIAAKPARNTRTLRENGAALEEAADDYLTVSRLAREVPERRAGIIMNVYEFDSALRKEAGTR